MEIVNKRPIAADPCRAVLRVCNKGNLHIVLFPRASQAYDGGVEYIKRPGVKRLLFCDLILLSGFPPSYLLHPTMLDTSHNGMV